MIKLYRKKPVVIEAMRFFDDPETLTKLSDFIGDTIRINYKDPYKPVLKIEIPKGTCNADVGDYIIREIEGGVYLCKPDIFEQTYEEVKDA